MSPARPSPRAEDGYVVALTTMVLFIGVLLASATVAQVVGTESSVRRDASGRTAVQAARAGVESAAALAIASAKTSWTTTGKECPKQTSATDSTVIYTAIGGGYSTTAATPDAWCAAVTRDVGADASYTYQISAPYTPSSSSATLARDVIATGSVTVGSTTVTRRLRQTLTGTAGSAANPFAAANVVALTSVYLQGSSAIGTSSSRVNVMSGGNIDLRDQGTAGIYGNANPGVGKTVQIPSWATYASFVPGGSTTALTANPTLPDATVPTTNDNAGIAAALTSSNVGNGWTWNATTRALVGSYNTLSLPGSTYVLCSLQVTNDGKLKFTSTNGSPIRVYIDPSGCNASVQTISDPCGGGSVLAPLNVANSGAISSSNAYVVQAYLPSKAYVVPISGASPADLGMLYAPMSTVKVCGSGTLSGAVAASVVQLTGNTRIYAPAKTLGPVAAGGSSSAYGAGSFVECTSSGGTSSLTGC